LVVRFPKPRDEDRGEVGDVGSGPNSGWTGRYRPGAFGFFSEIGW
jgi:hypothetical protein